LNKDAVSLFQRYASGGDNGDLKDWAGKALPALKTIWRCARAQQVGYPPSPFVRQDISSDQVEVHPTTV
jgi:putative membrane protein